MIRHARSRRLMSAVVTVLLAIGISACTSTTPNTTLTPNTEVGRAIDDLWDLLLLLGTIVFVLVEAALIFIVVKFRRREGNPEPRQVHGNTTLEITWTLIPAVVLAFIAVPTVRTIFLTQAKALPNALQVEVIGHQWWWEFRYPQYGFTTANELYLPVGRTVNFALRTADVLHSFWIPELAGKRDLVSNQVNYLWFTPESTYVWNGFCAEYCGASHANMHFKVFTVTPPEFDAWVANQKTGPAFDAAAAAGAVVTTPRSSPLTDTLLRPKLPAHFVPSTKLPNNLSSSTFTGDAARGAQVYKTSACVGCHQIQGVSFGTVGPQLTHVGSRTTIAAGIYPNDMRHMTLWIKNAPAMKPGSLMPPMGQGLPRAMGSLTDQQVADVAAYLRALK